MKEKRSRKQLREKSASQNPNKGVLCPKIDTAKKEGDRPAKIQGFEKARNFRELSPSYMSGAKIAISRLPL